MAIVRWDPFGDIANLQRDMNEMMGWAFGPARRTGNLLPPIDAFRTDEALVVTIELPGVRPDDVEVTVEDGVLTLRGERRADEKVTQEQWVRRERAYGSFERSFTLPDGVNPDMITASFENGLLELRIPHPPEKAPRRISIAGGEGQDAIDVGSSS